jgi:hypothetical protein
MFDVLVEPVMSYASHVWGPTVFARLLAPARGGGRAGGAAARRGGPAPTPADRVHLSVLRIMTGAGAGVSVDVLLRDLHRAPVWHHWVCLAVRWWGKLRARALGAEPGAQPGVACCAWRSDLRLLLRGCEECWSYRLLSSLEWLGVLPAASWRPRTGVDEAAQLDSLCALQLDPEAVSSALAARLAQPWLGLHPDPRAAPSDGVHRCTHASWVYPLNPQAGALDRSNAPPHMHLCLPFVVLRSLARLRLGWHHLAVHEGRMRRPPLPRAQRLCPLCSRGEARPGWGGLARARAGAAACVEDLRHFVLECPAYDHLRARWAGVFGPAPWRLAVHSVFCADAQSAVAAALHAMLECRANLMAHLPAPTA